MVQLQADHPGLKWVLPKDGGMIWTDNMLIPKGGNVYGASVLMNWYYDPSIAAEVEDYVNYICPVVGADKVLAEERPGDREEPAHLPDRRRCWRTPTSSTSRRVNNHKYKKAVPGADRRMTADAAPPQGSDPVPAARAGHGVAASSSSWCRCGTSAKMSLSSGLFPIVHRSSWAWGNFHDAITIYQTQFIRSGEYAGIATVIALVALATRSRTGSRSAAAAGRTSSCCS